MTITLLTLLLISNALSLRTDKSILFSRVVMVFLIHTSFLAYNKLFWLYIQLVNLLLTLYKGFTFALVSFIGDLLHQKKELLVILNIFFYCWQITISLELSLINLAIFCTCCISLYYLIYINSELQYSLPRLVFFFKAFLATLIFCYFLYLGWNIFILFIRILINCVVKIYNGSFSTTSFTPINKNPGSTPPNNNNNNNNSSCSPDQNDDDRKKQQRARNAKSARERRAWKKANSTPEELELAKKKRTLRSRVTRENIRKDPEKRETYNAKHAASERINRPIRLERLKKDNPEKYKENCNKKNESMRGKAAAERARLKEDDPIGYQALLDRDKKYRIKKNKKKMLEDEKAAEEIDKYANKLLDIFS